MKKGPAPLKKVAGKIGCRNKTNTHGSLISRLTYFVRERNSHLLVPASNGKSPPEQLCRADVAGQVTGFTLIELLVTLSIIAVILSVVLPITYNTYKSYHESLEAEKVLMFLSSMRRESFLHGKERLLETKDGNIIVDGEVRKFKGIYIHTEGPIIFYKNGTNSGGKVKLKLENNTFLISIQGLSGDLKLIRE